MGVLAAAGRIGAVAAQFVNGSLESNVPLLLLVTGGFLLVGGMSAWLLPMDNTGTKLTEQVVVECGTDVAEDKCHSITHTTTDTGGIAGNSAGADDDFTSGTVAGATKRWPKDGSGSTYNTISTTENIIARP